MASPGGRLEASSTILIMKCFYLSLAEGKVFSLPVSSSLPLGQIPISPQTGAVCTAEEPCCCLWAAFSGHKGRQARGKPLLPCRSLLSELGPVPAAPQLLQAWSDGSSPGSQLRAAQGAFPMGVLIYDTSWG